MPFISKSQVRLCYSRSSPKSPKSTKKWDCNSFLKHTKTSICSLPNYKGGNKKKSAGRVSKRTVSRINTGPRGGKYRVITEKNSKGKVICEFKVYQKREK